MATPSWPLRFAKTWFGHFSAEELKKFILLGITYGVIIGVYWTLRVSKDSVFMYMVGPQYRGVAKLISLGIFLPIVILYSKALAKFHRHKMMYVLATFYGLGTLLFGLLFLHPTLGLSNVTMSTDRLLAWIFYVFVESYGSLVPALFWAFAADITDSDSARRGFPFAVMIAQALSTLTLQFLTPLAGAQQLGSSAYVIIIAGSGIFCILALIKLFMRVVPKSQMVGYRPAAKLEHEQEKKHIKKGFLEGLRLLAYQPYLLGILVIVASYEIIINLIDFNFKIMVCALASSESACTVYLGENAWWINFISTLCLVFGASNIQRKLGIRVSLLVMPLTVALAVAAFYFNPLVEVLFWIIVGTKGLHYAVNSPSVKQLYVPTSVDVKYQSQAWIDTFGSRGAKAIGSGFTGIQVPLSYVFAGANVFSMYLLLSALFSSGLLFGWIVAALYLGTTYSKAVENKQVVC